MSPDSCDLSICIFDKFMIMSLMDDANIYENHNYISLAAAASILLSCKLHEGKSLLTMANFPVYKKDDLIEFERILLNIKLVH